VCSFTYVPSRNCDDADAGADDDDDDHDDPTHSSPGGGVTTNQDLVCFTSAIISCEKGGQWQQALSLFDAMQLSDLQLDTG